MRAELEFESILQEHEELLDQARGFGMRTAAFPRGLMPLREAQEIVANFSKNTEKLDAFLSSLYDTKNRAPDKATKDALDEVYARGEKALSKFQDDHKKAKEALAKHEDLLVGENFQEMFQALRLAVLDLDLTEQASMGAKTSLHLDATPAYAVGLVGVHRVDPKAEVYKVRATYRAETDEYVADMWSEKSGRWFPAAKKTGHARIPAFVKAVVDKMKAVHDFEGESMFGSRRTVEDTSPELAQYRDEVDARKERDQLEGSYKEAERRLQAIRVAIDGKLRQQFPKIAAWTHTIDRDINRRKVRTWSTFEVGAVTVQLGSTINIQPSVGSKGLLGYYGVPGQGSLTNPVPTTNSDSAYVDAAVKALVKFITEKIRAPAPAPAPTPGSTSVPTAQTVVREVRRVVQYPGTLGFPERDLIQKVLTGESSTATLTNSKIIAVPDQATLTGVLDLARGGLNQFKNTTLQLGDITITQKVTPKLRALFANSVRTVPAENLTGTIEKYFAASSTPQVTSLIFYVELTISKQGGRRASMTRSAGATTFDNLVWNPNISNAFRGIRSDELEEHGHRDGYPGTIAAKSRYEIRASEPMSEAEARAFMNKDVDKNDKWSDRAFAVPVTKERVLATDKVTVTVIARDEKEAQRQAKMRIFATGRFPPNATVATSDFVLKLVSETPRTKTFEVTGTRKVVMDRTTDGWLFYGWAPE
jgi:hypothetical protein